MRILVFQASHVSVTDMRAALPDKFAPIALLNSKDAESAKIFTMIHEVAHLLLGTSTLTGGTSDDFEPTPNDAIEKFCNRFASEVLMPREDIIRRVPRNWKNNDDEVLWNLAKTYCVSRSVVAYRLVECDLATATYLRDKWPTAIKESPRTGRRPAAA
jgi:Zn-dependent peptidase ImmA (M78 family)